METNEEVEQIFSKDGKLAAERPKSGTGVTRCFNDKGHVTMEGWLQNGVHLGYVKMFDTDGTLLMVKFWNNLKYLSKKRYLALCDKDSSLPRFEHIEEYNFLADDLKKERRRQQNQAKKLKQQDNTRALENNEAFCQKLLSQAGTEEAVSWLSQSSKGTITLGELPTNRESLQLARKIYTLGADRVLAVEISRYEDGENSGKLVIALPTDPAKRMRLFRWSNSNARKLGFDPDVDIGQKHLFIMLD
jgi:hypothetical protein